MLEYESLNYEILFRLLSVIIHNIISWRIRPVLVPYIEPLGDWDDIKSNRGHMVVLVTLHTQRSAITIIQDMSIVDYIVRLFMRI